MIYGFRAPMILRPTIVAMMVLTTAHAMAQDETADSVPSVASHIHTVSDYQNVSRTARYMGWTGNDITLHWRDASGISGLNLVGSILKAGDHGPSTDPTVPGLRGADVTLDSSLGRTLFLAVKLAFGS